MSDEKEEQQAEPTLREQIVAARDEVAEKQVVEAPAEVVEKSVAGRDEKGKFKAKVEDTGKIVADPVAEAPPAKEPPASWDAAAKAKFSTLPPDVQDYVLKRETEAHQALTKHDEERNFGKSIKQVVAPYEAIIRAEGGTPEKAVADLLNTAYTLRQGSPVQKAQLLRQVIEQYGVDPNLMFQQPGAVPQQHQPAFDPAQLKESVKRELQDEMETAKITTEIQAFAADPKNAHFEQVRSHMATLMNSGQASTLQDAYDTACWMVPEIRSTMLAAQVAEAPKPKPDIAAKKRAASSVTGSPGIAVPNTGDPNLPLREQIRAAMRQHT